MNDYDYDEYMANRHLHCIMILLDPDSMSYNKPKPPFHQITMSSTIHDFYTVRPELEQDNEQLPVRSRTPSPLHH